MTSTLNLRTYMHGENSLKVLGPPPILNTMAGLIMPSLQIHYELTHLLMSLLSSGINNVSITGSTKEKDNMVSISV